jgi:Fic family protein
MAERYSQADEPQLVTDPDEIARVESENALRQFDAAMEEYDAWMKSSKYRLRLSLILRLHRVLMETLSEYAGIPRPATVTIEGSRHKPPRADEVPALLEELCDYINEHWNDRSAVHLAAFVLWRMNWIHPFSDGNGRTARIVSYLVLCAHSRNRLPGELTIPEQIARNKQPNYEALELTTRL